MKVKAKKSKKRKKQSKGKTKKWRGEKIKNKSRYKERKCGNLGIKAEFIDLTAHTTHTHMHTCICTHI